MWKFFRLVLIVLETFLLPAGASVTIFQRGVQNLFAESCVGHVDDRAYPWKLVLHYCGGDAGHVGLLQNTYVDPKSHS